MGCAMKQAGVSSTLLVVVLLAGRAIVKAQQPTKIPGIGFLIVTSPSAIAARPETFRQGSAELGYVM